MTKLYPGLYATPFHARTAARNIYNAWGERGMFTVPRHFGNVAREAMAARFSAVMADVSPSGRLRIHGAGAARLLAAALRTDMEDFAAGTARDVFWTSDAGGVRGVGVLARHGEENFLLEAQDTDTEWFAGAAPRFGAKIRDERSEKGVLLLAGPLARAVLDDAGLSGAGALDKLSQGIFECGGVSVGVSRRPALNGYELSCSREDGLGLFDRLTAAGRRHALTLIGQDALELLYLESGIPLSGIDFTPTRDISGEIPTPASLGLASPGAGTHALAGLEFEGETPLHPATLYREGRAVGVILRGAYSHALSRTIAFANILAEDAAPGTEVSSRADGKPEDRAYTAHVVALPFLRL